MNEFFELIEDILFHDEFLKLKDMTHHKGSRYDHLVSVSYHSYKIAKKYNLDYKSVARGALLHDFFLYDWRQHKKNNRFSIKNNHGLNHPKVALENAMKYFDLNDKEKDIIVKHMWPKCIGIPKYKESYLVSFVDKHIATIEFLEEFGMKNKFELVLEDVI